MRPDLPPDDALERLLAFDGELRLEAYYGERSVFYNPRGVAPLGAIFASVKERDGPNDAAARLRRATLRRPRPGPRADVLQPVSAPDGSAATAPRGLGRSALHVRAP